MILLDSLGANSPLVFFCINMVALWKQPKFFWIFVCFWFVSDYANRLLKWGLQEGRPKTIHPSGGDWIDPDEISLWDGFDKGLLQYSYRGEHYYGMPSGHSQSAFFSTAFLWFVNRSVWLLLLQGFLCLITVHQRWKYRKHTVEQLGWGAVVGTGIAYLAVFIISPMLKKNI